MCSVEKSAEIAEKLDLLKQYPREPRARAVVAEMVQEICPTDTDADRLMREMRESYNTWPGPQEFATFARGKMRPRAARPELQEWHPEDRPKVECARCQDNGYVQGREGGFGRCDCDAGRKMPAKFLKLLQDAAQRERDPEEPKSRRTDAPMKPLAADIARVMRQKRERVKR